LYAEIALCACFTRITFAYHLLWSHLLTAQTFYTLAAQHLTNNHPLYELIHPHGFQVNGVDWKKGAILVRDNMAVDWSFKASGVKKLFHLWQDHFTLDKLLPHFSSKLPFSSFQQKEQETWQVISVYVKNWFSQMKMNKKGVQEYTSFSQSLSEIPHFRSYSLPQLVKIFLYVSIFIHEHVGDQATDIIENSPLFVDKERLSRPTDTRFTSKQILSKEKFRVIYLEATKDAYHLNQEEWIHSLPIEFQKIAQEFQSKMNQIDPQFKIGINS
jgi:hypothetical protein